MAESQCWQVATSVLVARFVSAHHFGTRPGTRKLKDKGHCEGGRLACWLGIEWVAVGFSLALWKRKEKKPRVARAPQKRTFLSCCYGTLPGMNPVRRRLDWCC